MSLKNRLCRLREAAREQTVEIPQRDGSVARFPRSALRDAYVNNMARLGAGPDAPAEHPLLVAARNSPDPEWANSFYAYPAPTEPIPDLSEPGPEG